MTDFIFVHLVVSIIWNHSKTMQRNGAEFGSLGYVRRQMPDRNSEGSRGRYAATPITKASLPPQQEGRGKALAPPPTASAPAPPPVAEKQDALKAEAVSQVRAELKVLEKSCEEITSTKSRVDQISMRLSVLDNAVKAQEKGVSALREEYGALSKNVGGQTAEKLEGVVRQVKTLEDSFCEFSARQERSAKQLREEMDVLAVDQSETDADGSARSRIEDLDASLAALAAQLRACEDALAKSKDSAVSQQVTVDAVVGWLQSSAIPDLKRNLLAADRSDIVQAAATTANEKLEERMQTEIKTQMGGMMEQVLRCSVDFPAIVLRATNGLRTSEPVILRHPITRIGDITYMRRCRRGAEATVVMDLFPVEDAEGPYVCFTDSPQLASVSSPA